MTDSHLMGFTCKEYIGTEACDLTSRKPLTKREDIYDGRVFAFITLTGAWSRAEVEAEERAYYLSSGGMGGALVFDTDDRHCWVVSSTWNKAALANWNTEEGA